jgi:tryptophan-rich sensory protein
MKYKNIIQLFLFIFLVEIIGSLGTIATTPNIPLWYNHLVKPPFNPPNWVFGPVWTTLFALMGTSLFLIWKKGIKKNVVKKALTVFSIQLGINVLWSFLFFGLKSPNLGLICIGVLWIFILLTIRDFIHISKIAGILLIPYLLWVSLAMYLNAGIAILNS